MKVRVMVEGDRELRKVMDRLGKAGNEAGARAINRVVERVVPQAKELAPEAEIEGGDLKSSIRMTKARATRSGKLSAGVVAGGPRIRSLASEAGKKEPGQYPSIIHEDTSLRHKTGQAKFIEVPFFREVPKAPAEILDELDREAKKAGV